MSTYVCECMKKTNILFEKQEENYFFWGGAYYILGAL